MLAACATPTFERYPPPPADEPFAEIEVMLMTASRRSAAGLYVPGAVRCARPGVEAFLNRTVEEPPRLIAGSCENRFKDVVRVPAGVPLPLRLQPGPR